IRRLVLPRVLAVVIMLPILTAIADVLGILGGLLIAVTELGITPQDYLNSVWNYLAIQDVTSGLAKTFFFGLEVALIGCYTGLQGEGGGPSGTGKSVTIRHINGLEKPDKGDVKVFGESIVHMTEEELSPVRRRVAMLFQGGALFDSMDVEENVGFPLKEHTDKSPREIAELVSEKLLMVGLPGTQRKMPSELSGGMRKRVALARSIALEPDIIMYDEPTTGLDPVTSEK